MTFALTKIQPPRPRAGFITRPRLDALLSEAMATRRLVLVSAPAGFGKTALLGRVVAGLAPAGALAWVSADEDDELGRFASCLVAALEPFDLPWRTSPEALVASLDAGRVARAAFTGELVNALLAAETPRGIIVVEDAHRFEDPLIFEFLDGLVERLPAHWALVISSRIDPPLALARLRARGELAELRQDALRFTEAEVRELLDAGAPAGGADKAAELLARTDGWAAGLTLFIGSAHRAPTVSAGATRRQLFDYLAAEVLEAMPRELRDFLLRCSVLPELSPARCAAVAGSAIAARLLAQVEQQAPFVSILDEREPVLRLHDLFRDCLDDLLRREMPGEVAELLKRAAGSEPDTMRRIAYLQQAGAWGDAEAQLSQLGPALVATGQIVPVARLIDQFPQPQREASPSLAHLRGLCAWAHWDLVGMCAALERAAAGYESVGRAGAAQRARVMMVIGLTAGGQVPRAVELLARVRQQPMDAHTEATAWQATSWHLLAGRRFADVAAPLARMVEFLERSDETMLWFQSVPPTQMLGLSGVRPVLQRYVDGALARTPAEPPTPLRVLAQQWQAALHLWAGRHEAAMGLLQAAASDCRWLNQPPNLIGHLNTFAALCHAVRGESKAALAAADAQLQGLVADERTSGRAEVWLNHMLYFKLRVAAALDDAAVQRELALRIEANANPAEHAIFLLERASLPARLAELDQRWDAAAELYAHVLAGDSASEQYGQVSELLARRSHALLQCRDLAQAAAALAPLFERVAASGEVGGVLLAGRRVLDGLSRAPWGAHLAAPQLRLLQAWAARAARGEPCPSLVAHAGAAVRAGGAAHASAPMPAQPDPLSPREREVLRCIAAGDSNKLIARAFDLSPNTVKRHVSNILDKLALNSRGQAAAWYRQSSQSGPQRT